MIRTVRTMLLCSAWLIVLAAGADAASAATYVAGCGNASYLKLRPSSWSNGCTGGALNVEAVRWLSYRSATAAATGRAELRMPCGDQPCYMAGVYKAKARLRMSAPRTCSEGEAAGERYFTRVRLRIRFRAGNPFGYRSRWKVYRLRIDDIPCAYSP